MSLANYAEEYEALIDARMKNGVEKVDADIEAYRSEKMKEIAEEIREAQKKQIAEELEAERNTSFSHLHQQIRSFMDELKLLEEQTKVRLTERISLHEKSETERLICEQKDRLARERDATLKQYALMQAKSVEDLELEYNRIKEEKVSVLLIETELERVKIRQNLEDQNQNAIYEFRTRLSDEYARAESAERKRSEEALLEIQANHIKAVEEANIAHAKTLEAQQEAETKVFKAKLHDEFARLRLVEKMLLQTELAEDAKKFKEGVKAEHAEFVRRLDEAHTQQKKHYAELLYNEKVQMEQERIVLHNSEIDQFRIKIDGEFNEIRLTARKNLNSEMETVRAELLQSVVDDVDAYKASLIVDIKKDVEMLKERELEEMRESLYVLAMERVREKMSAASSV